jgi:hypothetical protein
MLRQLYSNRIRRLLAAAVFPLIVLPGAYPTDSAFAAEPPVAGLAAQNSPEPAAATVAPITPAQARQTLAILKDEKKRAELAETLNAIALATEAREGMEAASPAVAAPAKPAAPVPAKPTDAKAPEAPIELTEGGVVAQLFDAIGRRLDTIGDQLRLTAHTLLEIKTVGEWWQYNLGDAERRAVVLDGLWKVAAILGGALLTHWLLRWALARPRRLVESHAAAR